MPLLRKQPEEGDLAKIVVRGKTISLVRESQSAIVLDADKAVWESCVEGYYHIDEDAMRELRKMVRNKRNRDKYFLAGKILHQSNSSGKTVIILPYLVYRQV